MGHALGARERNHCRTCDARRRPIAAKSEGESANRAHAPGPASQLTCVCATKFHHGSSLRLTKNDSAPARQETIATSTSQRMRSAEDADRRGSDGELLQARPAHGTEFACDCFLSNSLNF